MKQLVLLHGWGATEGIWQRQVAALRNNFPVLTPRILEWNADWLSNYLSDLYLRGTVVVGWSLGGMLLLEVLGRFLVPQPAAAVLVGTPAVFCQRPDHPWGQPAAKVRAMRLGLRSDSARVLTDFLDSCLAPGEEAFRAEALGGFDLGADPAYLAQGLDYLKDQDLRDLPAQINCPVDLIQGEQDGIVEPAQAQFLEKHLRDAELHLLPGAGHLPFITQAQAFNSLLIKLMGP